MGDKENVKKALLTIKTKCNSKLLPSRTRPLGRKLNALQVPERRTWTIKLPRFKNPISIVNKIALIFEGKILLGMKFWHIKHILINDKLLIGWSKHQDLVGTVTPKVIQTVPFSWGGTIPEEKWYSLYNWGGYSSKQRLAWCVYLFYTCHLLILRI